MIIHDILVLRTPIFQLITSARKKRVQTNKSPTETEPQRDINLLNLVTGTPHIDIL